MEALPRRRDSEQLIALLAQDAAHALTISDLLERGVKSPGQGLYELELAGYPLERVRRRGPGGHAAVAYRLTGDSGRPTEAI